MLSSFGVVYQIRSSVFVAMQCKNEGVNNSEDLQSYHGEVNGDKECGVVWWWAVGCRSLGVGVLHRHQPDWSRRAQLERVCMTSAI